VAKAGTICLAAETTLSIRIIIKEVFVLTSRNFPEERRPEIHRGGSLTINLRKKMRFKHEF